MRLAEFKMRLLVFVAERLLQWARVPQSNEGSLSHNAAEETPADSNRLPTRRGKDPRPEHWVRLITTDPPQSWIDLVGEKAPELLDEVEPANIDDEEVFVEASVESEYKETLSVSQRISELDVVASARASDNPANYPINQRARSWLNRLRFAPEKTRPTQVETTYVPRPALKQTDRGLYATSRRLRSASNLLAILKSERRLQSAKPFELSSAEPRLHQEQTSPTHYRVDESRGAPVTKNEAQSFPAQSKTTAAHAHASNETRYHSRETRRRTTPMLSLKRSTKHSSPSLLNLVADHRQTHRAEPFTESTQVVTERSKRERSIPDDSVAAPTKSSIPQLQIQTRLANSHTSRRIHLTEYPARKDAETNELLFEERPVQSKTSAPELVKLHNPWPELPPLGAFDFSDELSLREVKREALRRLTEEQRGNPWNA